MILKANQVRDWCNSINDILTIMCSSLADIATKLTDISTNMYEQYKRGYATGYSEGYNAGKQAKLDGGNR